MAVTPEYVRKDLVEYLLGYYGAMLTWSKEDVLSEIKRGVQENSISKDLVEVVRCKDCTHKVDLNGRVMCNRNARKHQYYDEWLGLTATENNHFCSYGERKCDE